MSWLPRRRARIGRIGAEAEADALIREQGVEAFYAARQREHEALSNNTVKYWSRIALAVASRTGKRAVADAVIPTVSETNFAPDCSSGVPLPRTLQAHSEFGQVDELKRTLTRKLQPFRIQFVGVARDCGPVTLKEVNIRVTNVSSAIIAAANLVWPPHTTGLRILDSEGREVFGRKKADRR
jgi:hypothetical protein